METLLLRSPKLMKFRLGLYHVEITNTIVYLRAYESKKKVR